MGIYNPALGNIGITTSGIERVRVNEIGQVGINTTAPTYRLHVIGTADEGWASHIEGASTQLGGQYVYIPNTNGTAVWGQWIDLLGSSSIWGLSVTTNGLINVVADQLAAAFSDLQYGDFAVGISSSTLGNQTSVLWLSETDFNEVWYVGYWDIFGYAKIVGPGTVNTVVRDTSGNKVRLTAPEAPEVLFFDFGISELQNGKAVVKIDPNLSINIVVDEDHPLRVFVQLESGGFNCGSVVVTEKTSTYFVVEAQNPCNATFSWMLVANRKNEEIPGKGTIRYADARFPPVPEHPVNRVNKDYKRHSNED